MPGARQTIGYKTGPALEFHYKFCSFFLVELILFLSAGIPDQYFLSILFFSWPVS